ncbi:TNFAIP3-interacting protein 1 [Candidatus Protochlamydia naegleriophila]|uniref:TNFAIP3-interacting protein 1 n=1 Tax=Candidatus Protochlamydia naegleriophila TaxID=389348 RepID=A0A0U5JDB8_9BACT|nr:hypothetical protein [Candidatus Protochlamydia naegleriophila]CUI17101.1 TNFAIP3-interacting protein 1 [Candidatus Protochlamydia naegleriophila]
MSMQGIGNGVPIHVPQSKEEFSSQSQSVQYKGHLYVKVDVEKGLIGFTSNSKLASTPMQIKKFMERHGNTLESGQAAMLEKASVKQGKITISERSLPDSLLGKSIAKIKKAVASVTSFIKNLGQTDSAITKHIHAKANERRVAIEHEKLSRSFEEKLGQGGLVTKLGTLQYLKSGLTEMEERLLSMDPESREAHELKEAIADTKQEIADKDLALRSKDARKQMMGLLKEVRISEKDSAEVVAAKGKFLEEQKELIDQMKSLTSIRFEENAEIQVINVRNGISQTLSIPTNFNDRVDGGRAIKWKGYSERDQNDLSVRKHVKTYYEEKGEVAPDGSKLGSAVSMSQLIGENNVNFEQLQSAATNKLLDVSLGLKIFGSTAKEGAAIIGAALNAIIQELPNDNIQNQHDLKQALMDRIVHKNQVKEMVDKDTFAALITGGKINRDLYQAPEFKEAERAFKNGSWGVDEEREITFTNFNPDDLGNFMKAIHYFFDDPDAQKVLENFVPLDDTASKLAADVAAVKRGDELTAQIGDLTRNHARLSREKQVLESELKAQMMLYDAGTAEGKAVTQPKIDLYREKIAELDDKLVAVQDEIFSVNSEIEKLG